MTISSWLNYGLPAPPVRGSAAGWKFLAPPYYSQRAVFASLRALFFIFFRALFHGCPVVRVNTPGLLQQSHVWYCWWTDATASSGSERRCMSDYRRSTARPHIDCSLKVYSAFHPSGVGEWVPAIAGKAKAGMAHSDCGWTCGCAGKTVRTPENTCHTRGLLRWWFTTKRRYRYIKCMHPLPMPFHSRCTVRRGAYPTRSKLSLNFAYIFELSCFSNVSEIFFVIKIRKSHKHKLIRKTWQKWHTRYLIW